MRRRQFELPAVEIARRRMDAVMRRKARATLVVRLFIGFGLLGAAWIYGDLGAFQLLLLFLAGSAMSEAVDASRARAAVARASNFFLQDAHPDDRPGIVAQLERASRVALTNAAWAIALVTAIAIWTAIGEGEVWVVLTYLAALIVLQLSIGLSGTSAPEFVALARAASEAGFRIAVFRPFGPLRSSLARNALVPVLAGYGAVEIVMDPTLGEARPEGILGGSYEQLRDLAEVHRYSNEDWKKGVEEVIRTTDIAIIDITLARPGVTWEMAKCYELLPPHRVYCAVDASIVEKKGSLIDHVREIYDQIESQADTDLPGDVRPYVFAFWPTRGHQLVIAENVHHKMCEIVALDVGAMERHSLYHSDTPDDSEPDSRGAETGPDKSHPALNSHPERVHEALAGLQPGATIFNEQRFNFSFGCGGLLVLAIVVIILFIVF